MIVTMPVILLGILLQTAASLSHAQTTLSQIPKLSCGPGHSLQSGPSGDRYMQVCVLTKEPMVKDGPFENRVLKSLKLSQSGYYRRNVLHGDVKVYSDNGNLTAVANFENGIPRRQSFYAAFNSAHKIKEVILTDNGRKLGKQTFWNLKGKEISEAEFRRLEPVWAMMEEGKVEVLRLFDLLSVFRAKHGIYTTDLVAIDYEPAGVKRFACGFSKPSKARVGPRGQRMDPSRMNTFNPKFRQTLGRKYRYVGQAVAGDLPPTLLTTTGFTVACVARFNKDTDVWTVDEQRRMTHVSSLGE